MENLAKVIICGVLCFAYTANLSLADTHYVDINNATPSAPYTTWATATTNIQDAVDEATDDDIVFVTNGTYNITSEIAVTSNIKVMSVNGPEDTIIDAQDNCRVLNLGSNDCIVSGFTLTQGYTTGYGGGVYCIDDTPSVTNCIISWNVAQHGGGMFHGKVYNSLFKYNDAAGSTGANLGGGLRYGVASQCMFYRNDATRGGGLSEATASYCILEKNWALQKWGFYVQDGLGGGAYMGEIYYSTIINNFAQYGRGGGVFEAEVYGSLIVSNKATQWSTAEYTTGFGGGAWGGTLFNCTVSDNSATTKGGGISDGTAYNCILQSNASTNNPNIYGGITLNSCSPDLNHGVDGNITNTPLFAGLGNYHLAPSSPCINAGSNEYVITSNDLEGYPRIIDGSVDMGAYESFFITNCYVSDSGFSLDWMSTPEGWNSIVKYSTNLVRMPFTNLSSTLPYSVNSYTDTVHALEDTIFYRVELMSPATMVLIPGGINSGTDPQYGAYSLTVDTFYMDETEVTKAQWDLVYNWALAHDYIFENGGSGKALYHPVHTVNWYDCVKWCNARSQMEGKAPCYTVGSGIYKAGESEPDCDFNANGYRLPTNTEWEYAARGGRYGNRFPWGDTISHSRANYYGDSSFYDFDSSDGYHPAYDETGIPYTSPVGSFSSNGYGLYGTSGNVWEWCWDSSGSKRRTRGGGWESTAGYLHCGYMGEAYPYFAGHNCGFRTVYR